MKIGKNKLKMSSGEVRTFGSEEKRDNFEKVARAYKHGWAGPKGKKGKKSDTGMHMMPGGHMMKDSEMKHMPDCLKDCY